MSGPAEDCCRVSMQQQSLGYPDARPHPVFDCCSECEEFAVAWKLTGRTVTYQTSACCSLTVVSFRVSKIDNPACDAPMVNRSTCIQVRADDVEELPCGVQEENCTCLLWGGRLTHVTQHKPVTMLSDPTALTRYLSFKEPHERIHSVS